jgi:hypothetical protein
MDYLYKLARPFLIIFCCTIFSAFIAMPSSAQTCPNPPVPTISSHAVPADVCIPSGFSANPIQFFDDFSWRSFVALVWPALNGQRGTPDTSKTVAGSGPRVFETYKALYEVFHIDGSAPSKWNNFDPPSMNPCAIQASFDDITLASFSKFSNVGQAGFSGLVGPLVAQNQTYVRFMTGLNQSEFEQILGNDLYLRSNLPLSKPFKDGSIDVKSSWIDMTNIPRPDRYYTRSAWLMDPATGNCSQTVVGLVGLHIVQKTPTRPQWIWTTFEQVDNVPPVVTGGPGTFNFNDGTANPMPSKNPYKIDPLSIPTPAPYNVSRIKPVHSTTQATNTTYQTLLAGTPWQFYQLVMTQWPLMPSSPSTPGTPQNTFPGTGATTAFANTTMETFDQSSVFSGCMGCHTSVQNSTDFLWTLKNHAFPPNVPNLLLADEQIKQLESLLANSFIPASVAKKTALADVSKKKSNVKPQDKDKHNK